MSPRQAGGEAGGRALLSGAGHLSATPRPFSPTQDRTGSLTAPRRHSPSRAKGTPPPPGRPGHHAGRPRTQVPRLPLLAARRWPRAFPAPTGGDAPPPGPARSPHLDVRRVLAEHRGHGGVGGRGSRETDPAGGLGLGAAVRSARGRRKPGAGARGGAGGGAARGGARAAAPSGGAGRAGDTPRGRDNQERAASGRASSGGHAHGRGQHGRTRPRGGASWENTPVGGANEQDPPRGGANSQRTRPGAGLRAPP